MEDKKEVHPRHKQNSFLKREMAQLIDLLGQTIHFNKRPYTWKPILRSLQQIFPLVLMHDLIRREFQIII
jgi:hypothetical protein